MLYGFNQSCSRLGKGCGALEQNGQGRLAFSPLKLAVVRAIDTSEERKSVLGDAEVHSPGAKHGAACARNDWVE
jgi:hypothetical protein